MINRSYELGHFSVMLPQLIKWFTTISNSTSMSGVCLQKCSFLGNFQKGFFFMAYYTTLDLILCDVCCCLNTLNRQIINKTSISYSKICLYAFNSFSPNSLSSPLPHHTRAHFSSQESCPLRGYREHGSLLRLFVPFTRSYTITYVPINSPWETSQSKTKGADFNSLLQMLGDGRRDCWAGGMEMMWVLLMNQAWRPFQGLLIQVFWREGFCLKITQDQQLWDIWEHTWMKIFFIDIKKYPYLLVFKQLIFFFFKDQIL